MDSIFSLKEIGASDSSKFSILFFISSSEIIFAENIYLGKEVAICTANSWAIRRVGEFRVRV